MSLCIDQDNFKFFEDYTHFDSNLFENDQLIVIFRLYEHIAGKFSYHSERFIKYLKKEDFLKATHYKTVAETLSITLSLVEEEPIIELSDPVTFYQEKINDIYNTMIFNNEFLNGEIEHYVR